MPLTQLDPNAALVVIDLQKCIVAIPCVHAVAEIVSRSAELARAFRRRGLPVVLVNVAGRAPERSEGRFALPPLPPDWTELVPELEPQSGDTLITKQRVGAFIGTFLDESLRQRGVTQVVLTGIATSGGVEATARSAHDLGYNVALVVDAMTDRDVETHNLFVEKIFPRFAETGTTADLLKLLEGGAAD